MKIKTNPNVHCKPVLKWPGGKTQLLGELLPLIPNSYGTFIEPFAGGAALFFAHNPPKAILADSNPEIINLYNAIASDPDGVIQSFKSYENKKSVFYRIRSQDWTKLAPEQAAGRTLFLNRHCFNGLYRVNKTGQFNASFGYYKKPVLLDEQNLHKASILLRKTTILHADYKTVLQTHAKPNDFIFLDPPYLSISKPADFNRYTKQQFTENNHSQLAKEVNRLYDMGCHVLLINANHSRIHELYSRYPHKTIKTKRSINRNGSSRTASNFIAVMTPLPF